MIFFCEVRHDNRNKAISACVTEPWLLGEEAIFRSVQDEILGDLRRSGGIFVHE